LCVAGKQACMNGGFILAVIPLLSLYIWYALVPAMTKSGLYVMLRLMTHVAQPLGVLSFFLVIWIKLCADRGFVRDLKPVEDDWSQCRICQLLRPEGSHHCRSCNACIVGWDHHCDFLGICIGRSNLITFWVLIGSGVVALNLMMVGACYCAVYEMMYNRPATSIDWVWLCVRFYPFFSTIVPFGLLLGVYILARVLGRDKELVSYLTKVATGQSFRQPQHDAAKYLAHQKALRKKQFDREGALREVAPDESLQEENLAYPV